MSTATAFKFHYAFPECKDPPTSSTAFDSVEITLAEAMSIWWNLETVSFITTGSRSGGPSINWTTQIGPTESIPFTPSSTPTKQGSYYDGTTPAKQPRERVCSTGGSNQDALFFRATDPSSDPSNTLFFDLLIRTSTTPGMFTLQYRLVFSQRKAGAPSYTAIIANPAYNSGAPSSPPYSGTINVLGVSLNWIGGIFGGGAWTGDAVSITETISPFTY